MSDPNIGNDVAKNIKETKNNRGFLGCNPNDNDDLFKMYPK
jgi:hypothetical protein